MTSGTPINQFLLSVYELSFPSILNIPFPSGDMLENCHNLDTYLSKYFPHPVKQVVQRKLEVYNKEISPFVKLNPLLDFLETHKNFSFQKLLDFGCGKGYMFNHLRCFRPSISRITGIDTELNVLNCINNKNSPILSLLPKIPKYLPTNEMYDVCIIISTLHHINRNEQRDILRHITHLLRDGGILYIYEDSWGKEYLSIEKTFADLDEQFNRLPLNDKQKHLPIK